MFVNNLKVSIKNTTILKDISFVLNKEDRVGLVGANGSGKSTLLKALSKNISIDSGEIKVQNETIGYLKQEITQEDFDYTILDYIKKEIGMDKIEERLHHLEKNLTEDVMNEYGELLNQYLQMDGYNFLDNLKIVLNGLNVKENLDAKIKILSGGEKIKILLTTLLLQNTDILLLDEPTNNLDLEAIEWLENHLKNSHKKMIIVSHDEMFLEHLVTKIYELENGALKEYHLSYSEYLKEKELEYNRNLENYLNATALKDKLKKQLQIKKEWANKGAHKKANNDNDKLANNYAKERTNTKDISKLTKEINEFTIPDFEEKKPIQFFFNFDQEKGNKDILIDHLICGYDTFTTPLLNFSIPFQSRLQIIGGNGSGKTTLIKTILKEIKPISGTVTIGNGAKIGYISQDTFDANEHLTVLEYLKSGNENLDLSFVFTLLNKFNIPYSDKDKLYKDMSPGERTRVNLAKIALNKINILIVDEITNHLDKEALDLIYELINHYEGTIISISHNRKYNEILKPTLTLDMTNGSITMH